MFNEILDRINSLVLVEWADKFLSDLADGYLSIVIDRLGDSNTRRIAVQTVGEASSYTSLIQQVEAYALASA